MTERSWYWRGLITGDASLAPYNNDEWSDNIRILLEADRTVASIIGGYLNNLQVYYASGTTVYLFSGAAIVDGKLYVNTDNISFAITVPGAGVNTYRIVLRKSWAAQTIVAARLELLGGPGYPVLTQNDGVIWEVPLANITVAPGPVVTLVDARRYLNTSQYRDLSSMNLTKDNRQKMQCGVVRWTGGASSNGNVTVTFPQPYDIADSIVVVSHLGNFNVNLVTNSPNTTQFTIYWEDRDGATHTQVDIAWIVMGMKEQL